MVLNDIIDQVSERPQSKATHFSSAYQVGYFPIKHSPIWLLLCCRTTMTRDPRWRTLCSTASREPRTWCVSGIVAGCGSGLQRYTHTLLTNVSEINVNKYYYWRVVYAYCLCDVSISISTDAAPSGVINHCVRPLHRAVHHAVYRGQCAVHECGPLRRGVRRNVSITVYQPRIRFYLNHPEYGQITKINIKISCPCDPCTTVFVLTVWDVGWVV